MLSSGLQQKAAVQALDRPPPPFRGLVCTLLTGACLLLYTTFVRLAALALQLLQQRTQLGTIEGAEDNVDLGALLTRLATITPAGVLKDKINAALAAYRSSIVKFQHDQILADVSHRPAYMSCW